MKNYKKWVKFAIIIGVNPLFIYLFAHVGGSRFISHIIKPFSFGIFERFGTLSASIITSMITLFVLWYLTYWLYKKKIFIKI